MTTTPRTVEQYLRKISYVAADTYDLESYIHLVESAKIHIADGMHSNLPMSQMMARCQHLTNLVGKGVIGCYQQKLFEANKQDWLAGEDDAQLTGRLSRIYSDSVDMALETGTSISFGMENRIAQWLVDNRKSLNTYIADRTVFIDGLIGVTLTWTTGSAMIHSDNEVPRMISATGIYKTEHNQTLNINDVIVSDSNRTQVLCNFDTTASYRVKRAFMKATTGASTDFMEKEGGDIKDNFTGEGSVYTLTYGTWVDAQNAVLTREADEREARSFDGLCIEFERIPTTTE